MNEKKPLGVDALISIKKKEIAKLRKEKRKLERLKALQGEMLYLVDNIIAIKSNMGMK